MKKYLSFLKLGWLDALEYRTEFIIGYIGWFVSLVIALYVWLAVTGSREGAIGDYDVKNIITYLIIIQILRTFIFSRAGFEINQDIQKGDLSNWLLKPVSYMFARFLIELSNNALRSIFGLAVFGVVLFFYNPELFATFTLIKILASLGVILLAHTISFLFISIIASTAFWVVNANRFLFIYFSILTIFSGMIIPLDLFPEHMASLLYKTPFPYVFFFPTKFIQGTLSNEMTISFLRTASFYLIGMTLILMFIFRAGVKKYEAVGK